MRTRYKIAALITIASYMVSLAASRLLPHAISLLIPTVVSVGGILALGRRTIKLQGPTIPIQSPPSPKPLGQDHESANVPMADHDPFWGSIQDYVDVIQDLIISESQKDALDNEIVEKSLSLLTRIKRLIPALKEMDNSDINHKVQRLVFKDLNGAINPFLKLSGEGKRLNRRLLLNGLRDIDTTLNSYVQTIEQKDLIELQTRLELIQRRYGAND